jgi:ADP-ribose pyrophosphatase YjhB (NUDIX family)
MSILKSTTDPFGGIILEPNNLPTDLKVFANDLKESIHNWQTTDSKLVWLKLMISQSNLIHPAVNLGFNFHHTSEQSLMLVYRLKSKAFIPPFASHYIGIGGVAINSNSEILVVREKYVRKGQINQLKLPGGAINADEHLVDGVIREVLEETGVKTKFVSISSFRHIHEYRYRKSDIYFVALLKPLSNKITPQTEEIEECKWMPLQEYMNSPEISDFNKIVVKSTLVKPNFTSKLIHEYRPKDLYEFFLPESVEDSNLVERYF